MKPVKYFRLFILLPFFIALPAILGATNAPITTITAKTGCAGDTLLVPVTVTNFTSIMAIQLRMDYDSTKLKYIALASTNGSLIGTTICGTSTVSGTTKKILFTWTANNFPGVTLANGSTIFTMKIKGLVGGSWTLTFNNTDNGGGDCEYADFTLTAMTDVPTSTYYFNGSMTINASVGGSVTGGSTKYYNTSTGNLTLSGHTGTVVKWQKQYNEGGYTDISGTAGLTVYSEIPAYTGTWDYRAVVQYNSCPAANSSSTTVTVLTPVGTSKTWTGTAGTDWTSPTNWSPPGTPVNSDNVIIPVTTNLPVVFSTTATCKDLLINSGAKLTVNPTKNIRVTGILTIQGP